jgi:hypothetical protein
MKAHYLMLMAAFSTMAQAQVVVTNPVSDVLSQVEHAEDIAKAVEQIQNQLQQIQLLTQQLQQVSAYVQAFGDPSQLQSIVGVDDLLQSLNTSGVGQTLSQLQQLANGAESLQFDADGLYRSIGETMKTPSGAEVQRNEDSYRKYAASEQTAQNFQQVSEDVLERRKQLKTQIAQTTQQLQASTTDAETQKLTGVLVGYEAELAAVDEEMQQALAQALVQDLQNRNDREKQQQARREELQTEFQEATQNYSKRFQISTEAPAFGKKP